MGHRVVQIRVRTSAGQIEPKISRIKKVVDFWRNGDDETCYSMLVRTQDTQVVTDRLQDIFPENHLIRIVVMPVEAVLPVTAGLTEDTTSTTPDPDKKDKKKTRAFSGISREELYADISRGADINNSFLWLVVFSTIVASIGLIENNVAVVIGAMVIAPLLGPNLALALSSALGDVDLMVRSIRTMIIGFTIALVLSILLGYFWPNDLDSPELLSRTRVGYDSIALALVSGAAAVLSLASGLSSVLVGVMVAVALLPPGATMGIMLGAGKFDLAYGALLLLAVNIVCVNLSAKLVFWFKGVQPRTWFEQQKAKRSMTAYLAFWIVSLGILAFAIYDHNIVEPVVEIIKDVSQDVGAAIPGGP